MTAKEYFGRIRRLKARIKAKEAQVEILRELAVNKSPEYTGMPHNPPKTRSPMEEAIVKALDMEKEADLLRSALLSAQVEAVSLINRLQNADHQNVLTRRYLRMESWEDIAGAMYCSESTVFRIHREALSAFEELLQNLTVGDS